MIFGNWFNIKIKDYFQLSGYNKKVKDILENNIIIIDNIKYTFTPNSSSKCGYYCSFSGKN